MKRSVLLLLAGAVIGSMATLGVMHLRPKRSVTDFLIEEIKHSQEIEEHLGKTCDAIMDADRVEVVVHSWTDKTQEDRKFMLVPPCEEYLRFELSDAQRDRLKTTVAHTQEVRKQTVSYCSFFAHFTIDCWKGTDVTHKIQIGFDCHRIRLLKRQGAGWVEIEGAESECGISSVRGFIEGLGIDTLQFSSNLPGQEE